MAHNTLPRFIVLKSQKNDKYLTHRRGDLHFSGTDFASLQVKFEVVPSSTRTVDGLVHLKCCYNNKYWACRPNKHWIIAEASEMKEDRTKWSCTLFKPVFFISNRIGFIHVHIEKHVRFHDATPHHLLVGDASNKDDYLDFFDWESLPILPQYIALKGYNGNYLSAYTAPQISELYSGTMSDVLKYAAYANPMIGVADSLVRNTDDRNVYLRLNSEDKGDQTVGNEVFTTPEGNIRLKSNHTGKFWKRSPNWIWPDSEDNTNNNPDTLFKVIKVSHNRIALRNLGNDKFCMSLTIDGKDDCLNAHSSTIPETAKFQVEELVEKREIFRVRFDEKAARVYEKEISHDIKSTDLNHTNVPVLGKMEFEYTKEESRTWTTSNSLKQSVEIEITAGPPDVVQGKLKFAREETTTVEDGKTLAIKFVKKFGRDVNVPPMSKVIANFRVTQVFCEVPYSYRQTETLTDGRIVTTDKDDGLCTCIHTKISFDAQEEKISSRRR